MAALDLPDVPRWVEAHGIAADPDGWRTPVGGGYALGHDAAQLIVLAGEIDPAEAAAFRAGYPRHTYLFARDELRPAFARSERAILHTLLDPDALPALEGAVVFTGEPPDAELAWAATRGPIWSAYVDGVASAFAYAPWRSATLFDVSVDVVPAGRQLGLGTIVAAAMIRDERTRGREPVWGADEGNLASLRLAKRLGFAPVDELWIAPPEAPEAS
ncbi:MAG: GNAT family N-acetyltransferase [Kofleriaceae bacterium]